MFLVPACGGGDSGPLDGVDAIVFVQKQPTVGGVGDIFRNLSYRPEARLVKLSPPTADGELTVLCCDKQGLTGVDITGYDINFDATEIVFSARLEGDSNYGLFILDLQTEEVEQLPTQQDADYIYPIYVPGDRILYTTTATPIEGEPQFRDEYNRGTTTQVASMSTTGNDVTFMVQNMSHRIAPSLMSDGRVIITKWNHVASNNAGQLILAGQDGRGEREAFGREGTGFANSYYKAVEIEPGRVLAIASPRSRTLQSGSIGDIRLGLPDGNGGYTKDMSEANASYQILTPGVPLGRDPSSATIGRYHDAYPLNSEDKPDLLVSWSDGPVHSETLAAANLSAMFGVHLLNTSSNTRKPIYDDPDYWELFPRPLAPRTAPREIPQQAANPLAGEGGLIGIMDVVNSSIVDFTGEEIYGVRMIEGDSGEIGVRAFGVHRTEGAAHLGTAVMHTDGSALARVPPFVPIRQQVINAYGLAIGDETVWIGVEPRGARVCGGCHENRTDTAIIDPGLTIAAVIGPAEALSLVPKYNPDGSFGRISTADALVATPGAMTDLVDVPNGGDGGFGGSIGLQYIFDNKCVSCHEGTPGPANPTLTITNPADMSTQTLVFDLRGQLVQVDTGEEDLMAAYPASHISLSGPDMVALERAGLVVEGDMRNYVDAGSAITSEVIKILNPPRLFRQYEGQPASPGSMAFNIDMADRYFPVTGNQHEGLLTAEEYYMLILNIDMNGQAVSRTNVAGVADYQ